MALGSDAGDVETLIAEYRLDDALPTERPGIVRAQLSRVSARLVRLSLFRHLYMPGSAFGFPVSFRTSPGCRSHPDHFDHLHGSRLIGFPRLMGPWLHDVLHTLPRSIMVRQTAGPAGMHTRCVGRNPSVRTMPGLRCNDPNHQPRTSHIHDPGERHAGEFALLGLRRPRITRNLPADAMGLMLLP